MAFNIKVIFILRLSYFTSLRGHVPLKVKLFSQRKYGNQFLNVFSVNFLIAIIIIIIAIIIATRAPRN